jgi:dihydrofolate reductase
MRQFKAIAAMSENRVIGQNGKIPWHLPEDFKWFKQMTTGQVVVMGRKTFEAIGKPLPHRTTIILSRSGYSHPGALAAENVNTIDWEQPALAGREVFICGGAEIYAQTLPACTDLYLTLVKRLVPGDAYFPPFEEWFEIAEEILDRPEFKILHYRRCL